VALARALIIRPSCLLLDEPLSNLDAQLRLEMRAEIRRVCREFKLTTVYVTHDQKEALSISDRMAVLSAGKVLQIGTPREVYRRPCNRLAAGFIGETNFIEGRLLSLDGGVAAVQTPIGRFEGVLGDVRVKPSPGAVVTVSIRPECWRLGHGGGSGSNVVQGRIGEATYLGEVAQYDFKAADVALKIFELNPRFLSQISRGDVHASVEPEDVVILTE
jgi:iron(III) transport system ATP-binding protein